MSLTPERHADPGANIKAARNALAAVFEVVAEEPFHTPGVGLHRNPLADATVQRQLRRGRARPTGRGGVRDSQAETAREVHAPACGGPFHAIDHVQVGIEREDVATNGGSRPREITEGEPRLERQRTAGHEAPPNIDRRPDAEPAAIGVTAASGMIILRAEIDAGFVLGTASGSSTRSLGKW